MEGDGKREEERERDRMGNCEREIPKISSKCLCIVVALFLSPLPLLPPFSTPLFVSFYGISVSDCFVAMPQVESS